MKTLSSKILIIASLAIMILAVQAASADGMNKIEYYNLAVDYANDGNFEEALSAADSAIAIDENFTLAYTTKAGILNAMGRYGESLESAEKATEIRPDQPEGWVNMASALIGLERYDEAVEASDSAIEANPEYIEGYITKGTALGELGRYDEEIAVSEKALEISPGDSRALANKGYAEDMINNQDTADTENEGKSTPVSLTVLISAIFVAFVLISAGKLRKN